MRTNSSCRSSKGLRGTIINQASRNLLNLRGTVAMARGSAPDSARQQFFINLDNNDNFNYRNPLPSGVGYAVFGPGDRGHGRRRPNRESPDRPPGPDAERPARAGRHPLHHPGRGRVGSLRRDGGADSWRVGRASGGAAGGERRARRIRAVERRPPRVPAQAAGIRNDPVTLRQAGHVGSHFPAGRRRRAPTPHPGPGGTVGRGAPSGVRRGRHQPRRLAGTRPRPGLPRAGRAARPHRTGHRRPRVGRRARGGRHPRGAGASRGHGRAVARGDCTRDAYGARVAAVAGGGDRRSGHGRDPRRRPRAARARDAGPAARLPAGGRRPRDDPHLRVAVAPRGRGGRLAARPGHRPARHGGDHAADGGGVLPRLLRDPARGSGARPRVPAVPPGPHRGVRRAPGPHPVERGRPPPHHLRRRRASGDAAAGAGADAGGRDDPGRPRARGPRRRPPAAPARELARRRRPGPHPVHVGQHRPAQGGAADAREPARQHPRDPRRAGHPARRRGRELAAPLSRHGAHRGVAGQPLHGHPRRHPVPAGLPLAPRPLAVGHPRASGHPVGGAQLRVRPVRREGHRRGDRGPRPWVAPNPPERLGSDTAPHPDALRGAIRPGRAAARRSPAGLRAGRVLGGARGDPAAPPAPRRSGRSGVPGHRPGRAERRARRAGVRVVRRRPAAARAADRRRGRRHPRRAPRGTGAVPRPVDDGRLLPQPRRDPGRHHRRRVARLGATSATWPAASCS